MCPEEALKKISGQPIFKIEKESPEYKITTDEQRYNLIRLVLTKELTLKAVKAY